MGDYYCVNCGDKFDEKPGRYETFGCPDSNEQPSDKPLTLNSSTEKNLSGESIASDGVADKTRNPENEKTADSGKIPDKSAEGDAVNEFSDGTAENGERAVGKGENCFRCCPCCPKVLKSCLQRMECRCFCCCCSPAGHSGYNGDDYCRSTPEINSRICDKKPCQYLPDGQILHCGEPHTCNNPVTHSGLCDERPCRCMRKRQLSGKSENFHRGAQSEIPSVYNNFQNGQRPDARQTLPPEFAPYPFDRNGETGRPVQGRNLNATSLVFSILNIIFGCCWIGSFLGIISLVLTVMASSAQSEREEISRLNVANVINIVAVVSTLILVVLFFIGMF